MRFQVPRNLLGPVLALTALVAVAAAPPAHAAAAPAPAAVPAAPPAVDPAAVAALERMGTYLRGLAAFRVRAVTTRDEVLDNGLKQQVDSTADVLARRPNGLRARVASDRQERLFYYDGKQFTLWAPRVRYYATVAAPPTVSELVGTLESRYAIELPLVDLFRWGSPEAHPDALTAAVDLGPATIDETTCEQYAFRQDGLDWQLWVQQGAYPLPRRVLLTTTDDEARPQFQATYTWDLAPSFNDAAFVFEPPTDAQRIPIAERPADGQ